MTEILLSVRQTVRQIDRHTRQREILWHNLPITGAKSCWDCSSPRTIRVCDHFLLSPTVLLNTHLNCLIISLKRLDDMLIAKAKLQLTGIFRKTDLDKVGVFASTLSATQTRPAAT